MDVVIPLGFGSKMKNEELRYSLRSIEKHVSGIGNVFIVTDLSGLPSFLKDVVHIKFPDMSNVAAYNTCQKILAACRDWRLSEDFLLSNDDFFINDNFIANQFPNFFRGDLLEKNNGGDGSVYATSKKITAAALSRLGYRTRHFGVHSPMTINKTSFKKILSMFDLSVNCGYLTRSLYGNVLGLSGELVSDCKLGNLMTVEQLEAATTGKRFFSISDRSVNSELKLFLQTKYPDKSRWEV